MKIEQYSYDQVSGSLTISGKIKRDAAMALLIAGEVMAVAPASEAKVEKPTRGKDKPAKAATVAVDDEDEGDEEDDEEDEEDDEGDDDDEDEDDDDGDDEPAPKQGKPAKGKKQLKITPAMKSAKKLRDVVMELVKQGVKEGDLVAACKALREKIPVLARIAELEKRVPQAYEMVAEDLKK
jgi:hypothetical protein